MNIITKIWDSHIVSRQEGFPDVLAIDLHLMHEVTSPQAFTELRERGLKVHAPERTLATVDHIIPTTPDRKTNMSDIARNQVETLRRNSEEFGIRLLDMDSGKQGIVHVIAPELGIIQPGMTVVCGDSHTSTHGALGAIAFGIGTTEIAHVLATGCLLRERPKTMRVHFKNSKFETRNSKQTQNSKLKIPKNVMAKDMILKLIQVIGIGGATGHIIHYAGVAVSQMSMEERMTICNMSIECGARAGLISPDETTFDYLKGRPGVDMERWDEAIAYWKQFSSGNSYSFSNSYNKEVTIDITDMAPMVTWGTNPAQGTQVDQPVPDPDSMKGDEADLARAALEYTGLTPGQSMIGLPIDYVFIGSCTNGRISDLRAAAEVLKGQKISDRVTAYVVPGSEAVRQQAMEEGLDKIFTDAGCEFCMPGCSMCLAMNDDKVPAGKRCASTSNRNFPGRQGKGSITHLMSPKMAAMCAVEGMIVKS